MRAPRAGRWGPELFGSMSRSWEEGWGEGPRRKEGRQASCRPPGPLSPPHTPSSSPLLSEYVCARRSDPLTHTCPWMKGVWSLGIPKGPRPAPTESPHSSSSPQLSLHFVASFTGLVSTEG